jgi:hypothetical protein
MNGRHIPKQNSIAPKNRLELSPGLGDNFSLNVAMRNTVHGTGGFFEQRNVNVKKRGIQPNSNLIEKFIPTK